MQPSCCNSRSKQGAFIRLFLWFWAAPVKIYLRTYRTNLLAAILTLAVHHPDTRRDTLDEIYPAKTLLLSSKNLKHLTTIDGGRGERILRNCKARERENSPIWPQKGFYMSTRRRQIAFNKRINIKY